MAFFEKGDTVKMGKSASIPSAKVLDVFMENGTEKYRLEWTNGNVNVKPAEEIDSKAINTTKKF